MFVRTLCISLLFFTSYSSLADQTNLSDQSFINHNGDQAAESAQTIKESILQDLFTHKNLKLNVGYQQYFPLSPHCSTYVIQDKKNPGSFTITTQINHHTQVFKDPSDLDAYRTLQELCKSTGSNDVAIDFDSKTKAQAQLISSLQSAQEQDIANDNKKTVQASPTQTIANLVQRYNSGKVKTFNDSVNHIAAEIIDELHTYNESSEHTLNLEQFINEAVPLITSPEDYTDTEYTKKIMQTCLQLPLFKVCDAVVKAEPRFTFDAKAVKILLYSLSFYLQTPENKQDQITHTMPSETLAYITHRAPQNIGLLATFFGQNPPAKKHPYTINLDEMAKPCQIDQILEKPTELLKLPFVKKLYRSLLMKKIGETEEEYLQRRTKETDYKILNAYKQAQSFDLPGIQSKINDCDKAPIRALTVEFTITKEALEKYQKDHFIYNREDTDENSN